MALSGATRLQPLVPSTNRPRLLVSVRNAQEAALLVGSSAAVVDVKEPSRGALGRADAATVWQVAQQVAGQLPVTAALGELGEISGAALTRWAQQSGAALLKIGIPHLPDAAMLSQLTELRRSLPASQALAPVLLADRWQVPPPDVPSLLPMLDALAANWVIVDTQDKQFGHLFNCWPPEAVQRLAGGLQTCGKQVGIAGGLVASALDQAVTVGADLIGVRGAVCQGGRTGTLSRQLVAAVAGRIGMPATTTLQEKI